MFSWTSLTSIVTPQTVLLRLIWHVPLPSVQGIHSVCATCPLSTVAIGLWSQLSQSHETCVKVTHIILLCFKLHRSGRAWGRPPRVPGRCCEIFLLSEEENLLHKDSGKISCLPTFLRSVVHYCGWSQLDPMHKSEFHHWYVHTEKGIDYIEFGYLCGVYHFGYIEITA